MVGTLRMDRMYASGWILRTVRGNGRREILFSRTIKINRSANLNKNRWWDYGMPTTPDPHTSDGIPVTGKRIGQ